MKEGEKVYRLVAYRDVQCEESGRTIPAGQTFLLDIIPYPDGSKHNHKIGEECWHGPKDIIIDLTKKPWRKGFREDGYRQMMRRARRQPWRNY